MSLKARVDKLHSESVSDVTSAIIITKDKKIIRSKKYGTNKNKVVAIVVNL
jgi:hypothetical protein